MKSLEIYIHIPFCVKKCAYCDFLSAPATEEAREMYVELLCEEILAACGKTEGYIVTSIFFGGGTPSLLTGKQAAKIMQAICENFEVHKDVEITLEMNPGTVTAEKLEKYRESGINRLSIGLQSAHDAELKMLGRIHTYAEFQDAYRMAQEAGFENINIDLISAIPGQTVESWEESLRKAASLKPGHISAYSLIIEPGTPFYEWYGDGKTRDDKRLELPDEDDEREIYRRTKEILEELGYHRYEISNYARPGFECRHNLGYWERVPYLGFGIGAASFFKHARYSNPSEIEGYKKCISEKFNAPVLSQEEEMEEFMFLGLRKMNGVSKEGFKKEFRTEIESIYGKQIEKLIKMNLIEELNGRLLLTEKGIDVSNAVFVEFMF